MVEAAATPAPRKRRWFRFSLQSICVIVACTAILAAWIGSELRVVVARQAFQPRFNDHDSSVRCVGLPFITLDAPTIPLVRRLLGDYPRHVLMYFPTGDEDGSELRRVQSLFPEATIFGQPGAKDLPKGVRELEKDAYFII